VKVLLQECLSIAKQSRKTDQNRFLLFSSQPGTPNIIVYRSGLNRSLATTSELMQLGTYTKFAISICNSFLRQPLESLRILRALPLMLDGSLRARDWPESREDQPTNRVNASKIQSKEDNQLKLYFDSHKTGRGIVKWEHYFEIYDSHFKKFIGREINLLEIGVFSGGSLQMWKSYFGSKCRIFGVDIRQECKAYEDDQTRVFIGDQADSDFWRRFREAVPRVDIVIDDGSHVPEHQVAALEQLLPHVQPGGVYLCEDVHGLHNRYAGYMYGFANRLNELNCRPGELSPVFLSKFQRSIKSVHLYPFVIVIEKVETAVDQFLSTRRGTEW